MLINRLNDVFSLPRARQPDALRRLSSELSCSLKEEWNTEFGAESLYEAWACTPLMQELYRLNREQIRSTLRKRAGWRIVEIGVGSGGLWENFFVPEDRGELVLIDPLAQAHQIVSAKIPAHISVTSQITAVEDVCIPDADVVVCSLALHHVPGIDAAQCRRYGIQGGGKLSVLENIMRALQKRSGTGIINEADVLAEITLPPGSPLLRERLIDSYVRRCAYAVAHAIEDCSPGTELRQRWEAVILHWCIDQVDKADVPLAERDVYELDAPRWIELLERAGAHIVSNRFTDEWCLFQQYVFTAAHISQ